ncbi:MAG TPA: BON domain-containing protein [Chitinophagaceae bacterium]|nr:BON domain-containing protein [Chitinophagaceae bacterium]
MSKNIIRMLIPSIAYFLLVSVIACKSRTSDADVKTAVDNAIAANSNLSGIYTDVKDGVVTLSGQVQDEAEKASAESMARGINGVKSVVNNLTVTPPAPVVVTADEPLKASVDNTVKSYPGVTATVQDGVITLTGQIKRADLQNLMIALNSLKPKKIENKLTIN